MRRILAIAVSSLVIASAANATENWTYELGLYGWLAGLEGTNGFAEVVEDPLSATCDDLAGYVDFALAGHFEARGPRTVYLADISYTGLGSERDAEVHNQPVEVDMDLNQWIIELDGGYRIAPKFDILLAGRYYFIDTGATFSSVANEESDSVNQGWFDVFIGARYYTTFGERWFASIRGDIGAGGSDFAWFGQASLGYQFSDHIGAVAAWRILSLDYNGDEGSNYFRYDIVQSGLGLGLGYRF